MVIDFPVTTPDQTGPDQTGPDQAGSDQEGLDQAGFAARLTALGPFEPHPRLAAGVSGGPDSSALALLAARFARDRGGSLMALIVDHGLRPDSATEAAETRARLAEFGIPARILPLAGLARGPGLAARARAARLDALTEVCRTAGLLHLLLGHHAEDQAETCLMRRLAGSGAAGLAGMSALREVNATRILRPLLTVRRAALRAICQHAGLPFVIDPSNHDPRTGRARARAALADTVPDTAQAALGHERAVAEADIAEMLARRVRFHPGGYALLTPGAILPAALARVLMVVGGRVYPPRAAALARLAADPRPATLAGARLLAAGRLGEGWLVVRETPPPPIDARPGVVWGRFTLVAPALPPGLRVAALGSAWCDGAALPFAVRRALPSLWQGDALLAVPQLGFLHPNCPPGLGFRFTPPAPAAGAPFFPAG